jgi:hypothetical protein
MAEAPDFLDPTTQSRSPEKEILAMIARLGEHWGVLRIETDAEEVALRTLRRAEGVQVDSPRGVARLSLAGLRWKSYLSNPGDQIKVRGFVLMCVWEALVEQKHPPSEEKPRGPAAVNWSLPLPTEFADKLFGFNKNNRCAGLDELKSRGVVERDNQATWRVDLDHLTAEQLALYRAKIKKLVPEVS